MSDHTTILTAPDLSTPPHIAEAFNLYREMLAEGHRLQHMGKQMAMEADMASDDRARMKTEYRERRGAVTDADNLIADARLGTFKVMGDAANDNKWYMRRSVMYSQLATAEFAKAAAIMSYISAQLLQNSMRMQRR